MSVWEGCFFVGVSKELILPMDSLHQIEMSKISTESGSSY